MNVQFSLSTKYKKQFYPFMTTTNKSMAQWEGFEPTNSKETGARAVHETIVPWEIWPIRVAA